MANDDISTLPELGTAVSGDALLAVNSGEAAGARTARILFDGSASTILTGAGTFVSLPVDTNLSDSEVETAYNNQVAVISTGDIDTGTSTDPVRVTPALLKYNAETHGTQLTDSEVETAYNNQVAQVSAGEITAGTETAIKRYSPADVKAIVDAHASGSGATLAEVAAADLTFTGDIDLSGANSVTMGTAAFADRNYTPTAGQYTYDNTVTGLTDGCIAYHNNTEVRYVVDVATLPTEDDQVPAYNSTTGKWVPDSSFKFRALAVADLNDTTTPSVLTTAETTNTNISNYKSTGADHVFTMPSPHAAGNGMFTIGDEFQIDIEPASGDNFYLNGTAMATDEHIQNTADTLGEYIVYWTANINGILTWMFESKYSNFVEATP